MLSARHLGMEMLHTVLILIKILLHQSERGTEKVAWDLCICVQGSFLYIQIMEDPFPLSLSDMSTNRPWDFLKFQRKLLFKLRYFFVEGRYPKFLAFLFLVRSSHFLLQRATLSTQSGYFFIACSFLRQQQTYEHDVNPFCSHKPFHVDCKTPKCTNVCLYNFQNRQLTLLGMDNALDELKPEKSIASDCIQFPSAPSHAINIFHVHASGKTTLKA
jgi:hypothetical protein